jgi:HSP20 family protein
MQPYVLNQLQHFFDKSDFLFSNVFDQGYHFISDETIKYPAIDMAYDDKFLFITVAVCGLNKKDISIEIKDDILNIKHKPSTLNTDNKINYLRQRISRKAFDLSFKISPKCDTDNVDVSLENGELILKFPVKDINKPKSKQLEIK